MANLWKFIDNEGAFKFGSPQNISGLCFPLCNGELLSSISPTLHGDIKINQDAFLLQPASREDLRNLKSNRNFWLIFKGNGGYSVTGEPPDDNDEAYLEAGFLWHRITRANNNNGVRAEILNFIPPDKNFEVMSVRVTNIKKRRLTFTPLAAIPIYGRSAENLRDHRHVTGLLNHITVTPHGVMSRPAIKFDESGHRVNHTTFYVFGFDAKGRLPKEIFPTVENFAGEGGSLQRPAAVFKEAGPLKTNIKGKEAFAGLKFPAVTLRKNESAQYFILMGISPDPESAKDVQKDFCGANSIEGLLKETVSYWQKKSGAINIKSGQGNFDNWFKWVNIQPTLRRFFGCSFLPDFDYGKGGRGWRDLWQDALGLLLAGQEDIRKMLISNFAGVRIDGSNATIIGKNTGEFIADRNRITRVWMDHGVWPFFTLELYINQTRDIGILLEETPYFSDPQAWRARKKDPAWDEKDGKQLKAREGGVYKGSIIEHILLQHLVQFFNVGEHNNIRLESADWNDGLDMAPAKGESVAFSCFYARNLKNIAALIQHIGAGKITVFEEMCVLLDTLSTAIDYDSAREKTGLLEKYFSSVDKGVSGVRKELQIKDLAADLNKKAGWMSRHINENEWLKQGFFNGYYDNEAERVEGSVEGRTRMTLTGQVFPILAGIADKQQIESIINNVNKYLRDKRSGGIRLNTNFGADYLKLGRAFSFAYGEKENGSFFSHMNVMYAFALYRAGFVKEGFSVLDSIYKMAVNSSLSRIYPCVPEYFNSEGRGMYCYLTGSASWFILTWLCEVFGIKGLMGDLLIEPKLLKRQFGRNKTISIKAGFAGRDLLIKFANDKLLEWGSYKINEVLICGKSFILKEISPRVLIPREKLLKLTHPEALNEIIVSLS